MQPHGKSDTGVDAGRNDAALKMAEPAHSRVRLLAARGSAALLLVAFAALLALPLQAQAQTAVWSGTLPVRDLGSGVLGCSNFVMTSFCSARLSDDEFTHDGTNYPIVFIFLRTNEQPEIDFDTDLTTATQGLTLNVDGTAFAFEDANTKLACFRRWNNTGLSWSAGDSVSLTLTEAATASIGAETDGTGDAEGVEGDTIELTVKLSAVSAGAVTGKWRYVSGTAGSTDYSHDGNQNLTIAAGDTTATVNVDLVDDDKYEGEESFEIELYDFVGATIDRSLAQITINVDTNNPDLPSFLVDPTTVDVNEDNGTVTIPIVNDANEEDDETFDVEFGAPSVGAFDSGGAKATVTIEANDTASDDATLSDLELEDNNGAGITLSPTFASGTLTYTALMANDGDATYEIQDGDGSALVDAVTGTTGFQVDLSEGENTVKVEVTAQDTTTKQTYQVTVTRRSAHSAPTFNDGTSTSREFNETIGEATVTTASDIGTAVAATDMDTGDTLAYSLSGTDAAKFEIITTNGQIQTKSGEKYSYETDTSYSVTVTVEDGNGGSDTIDVTLNVTDQDEPPLRPEAPTVRGPASNSTTSLRVTMTAPDNLGRPPITRYKLRTHRDGFGWTTLPYNPSSAQNITGITSGKRYHVQFRVKNDEGEGPWSPTTFGYTKAHASGMPDISGTARVGRTLTAGTSGISDGNGKSKAENGDVGFAYTYQWVRVDGGTETDISGETASTYTLTMADLGKTVKVTASFKDNAGYAEGPLTSAAYPSSGTIALLELSFAENIVNVDEEAGSTVLTVNLAPASTETVTVDYATRDFHAEEGEDYTATSGTLTFAANETSKTITIPILNDDIYEGLETFFVDLSNPSGTALPAIPTKAVLIASDDAVPTASMAPVTVDEGAGTMTLTLRVSHPSGEDITYSTIDDQVTGTATEGDDYDDFLLQGGRRARITIPAGNLSQTFNISIVNDNLEETDETIVITWEKLTAHTVTPERFNFTGTIEDDDAGAGAARGKPRITGTAEVGRTLTANTSGISDQNGNTKAENGDSGFAYTYQWYLVDAGAETQITGARGRGRTYTLVQADADETFRVEVRFTDDAGNSEGPLKSNEYPVSAVNGELQLVDDDGPTVDVGRLEVFHKGEWGTVCDDRLDNPRNIAPRKACQFMGYATGEWVKRDEITPSISVAPDSKKIWLDDVRCFAGSNHWTGAPATKLHHCYNAGWELNNCTHDEDVHLSCSDTLNQTEATGLTASIEDAPTNHDGTSAFTFRIAFSAEVEITPQDMRDHALVVNGGTVTAAAQVDGRKDLWELTLEPAGTGPVSILTPLERACTETGALCTAEGVMLTVAPALQVAGPAAQGQQALAPLAAGFTSVPAEHDGQTAFWLELTFDAAVAQGSKPRIQTLLGTTGGSVTRMRRKDGRLDHWRIKIQPSSHEAVTVTLSPSPPCGAAGAVCTEDGRMYTTALATRIQGPPGLTVADAEVQEGPNAVLSFSVTLSRAPSSTVTVDYATADGTATAGSDYTAVNGTLTFAAGETEKTVSVAVLDDTHDEGSETLSLTLSNASGAYIEDGAATGTINNTDHMPKAWLARFGRTVAEQVLDAVGARVEGNSNSPGPAQLTLGGHQVVLDASWRGAEDTLLGEAGVLGQDLRETRDLLRAEADASPVSEISTAGLLMASSLHMASADGGKDDARWSLWARGSRSSFSGREDALTLEGDVSTGVMGADYERGRVLAGVALAYSAGEGSYTEADARGEVESTLLSAYPYLRYTLSERLSVWSVLGLGEGGLTLDVERNDERIETDISLAMAAFGARGKLASVAGYDLAVKTDVLFVRTESEAATGLAAADARTRRLRVALEGSREVKFESGVLTPSLEIGLRHDGGDAETGSGLELGGGLRWAGLKGFSVEVRVRGLLAHEERDYEEWGVSASLGLSPGEGDRGLSMRVGSVWGAASGGVERLWSQRALSGGSFDPDARLEAEVGYGLDAMRGLLTPYTGVALSEGGETWRAGARFRFGPALELNLEASLTEPDGDGETGSGLVLRGTKRW